MANGNDGPFRDERHYTVEPGKPPVEPKPGDGDIVWRYDMLNRLPVFPHDAANCSPLVYGDCSTSARPTASTRASRVPCRCRPA